MTIPINQAVDAINTKWHSATEGMELADEQSVLEEVKDDIEARLEEIDQQLGE